MPQLKVLETYKVRGEVKFTTGQIIDVTPRERLFFLQDAPGCFEDHEPELEAKDEPETKEVDGPEVNKQVRSSRRTKAK